MTRVRDDYLLDLAQTRRGYPLNRLLRSLMDEGSRQRFSRDEAAYCAAYRLSAEQQRAVMQRDWAQLLELGASVFCAFKLAMVDRTSMQDLGAAFTGMSAAEFTAVMRAGGRRFG